MCIARIFRRVFSIQRMVKIFAEDLSYPKTRKGRIMVSWCEEKLKVLVAIFITYQSFVRLLMLIMLFHFRRG